MPPAAAQPALTQIPCELPEAVRSLGEKKPESYNSHLPLGKDFFTAEISHLCLYMKLSLPFGEETSTAQGRLEASLSRYTM